MITALVEDGLDLHFLNEVILDSKSCFLFHNLRYYYTCIRFKEIIFANLTCPIQPISQFPAKQQLALIVRRKGITLKVKSSHQVLSSKPVLLRVVPLHCLLPNPFSPFCRVPEDRLYAFVTG